MVRKKIYNCKPNEEKTHTYKHTIFITKKYFYKTFGVKATTTIAKRLWVTAITTTLPLCIARTV